VARVLICSPVRLYREGLADVLSRTDGMSVVDVASTEAECLDAARRLAPGVTLLDLMTGGSLDTIRTLASEVPATQVVALAVPEREAEVINCIEAGASAFLTREQSLKDLLEAVDSVSRGEVRLTPRHGAMLVRRINALAGRPPSAAARPHVHLTRRQHEILALLGEGLSNKQIAARLCIELPTVKNHVHSILEKLAVGRRSEAVAWLHGQLPAREIQSV
jgi:two-component system, NarL family, nitrate/nitrite response regulator NarL